MLICIERKLHSNICFHVHGIYLAYTNEMGMLVPLGKGTRNPGLREERNLDYTVFLLGQI